MRRCVFSPFSDSIPNRSIWPSILSFRSLAIPSSAGPTASISERRLNPMLSKQPARIIFSIARRLSSFPDMRRRKSSKSRKAPPAVLSAASSATAPRPTPLIAASPKRILLPATVKSASDSLTSGGSREMPISRHSAIYTATLELTSSTEVRRAAIYCCG